MQQPTLPVVATAVSTAGTALSGEAALGQRLFFDPRLSKDGRVSCASCHQPGKAFSDGRPVSIGVGGAQGRRNAPTLVAAGRQSFQFWDGRARTLEQQALGPIQDPHEMAMPLPELVARLEAIPTYSDAFRTQYNSPVTPALVGRALASYQRTLTPPADDFVARLMRGDRQAVDSLTPSQRNGYRVFHTKGCAQCHSGPDLRDNQFHNLGVGMDKAKPDLGRYEVTKKREDWGAFKTPTLRNLTKTAPYMHDGSIATLEEVVEFYDEGGIANRNLSPLMKPLNLTEQDEDDLVTFLKSLTDSFGGR